MCQWTSGQARTSFLLQGTPTWAATFFGCWTRFSRNGCSRANHFLSRLEIGRFRHHDSRTSPLCRSASRSDGLLHTRHPVRKFQHLHQSRATDQSIPLLCTTIPPSASVWQFHPGYKSAGKIAVVVFHQGKYGGKRAHRGAVTHGRPQARNDIKACRDRTYCTKPAMTC
jgi:hypothetical protein